MHVHAAATTHDFTGDKARFVAHEKEREVGNVFWLTDATQRHPFLTERKIIACFLWLLEEGENFPL
jgi:hypothetical protein